MSVTPEQQLRAYVEYFRDLGVYELYQHESPQVGLPERWRELLARPKPPAAQIAGAKLGAGAAAVPQREVEGHAGHRGTGGRGTRDGLTAPLERALAAIKARAPSFALFLDFSGPRLDLGRT